MLADVVAAAVADAVILADFGDRLLVLLLIVAVRGVLAWLMATLPQRAAASVKLELRTEIVRAATALHSTNTAPTGEVTAIAGRGLDALDPYFARFLPELIRSTTVPIAVLIALLARDLTAALIVAGTLPLIPLFGALIGAYTERRTRRQWRVLAVLSHHFLDIVRGLPTLKIFGRASAQADTIARVTEQHRLATMATLRVALLSALVLELAATISVALVAVSVGLRLVHGEVGLETAVFLLILAPEAYLPLRRAAAEYHTAAEGLAAAERGLAVIDQPGWPDAPDPPDSRGQRPVAASPQAVTVLDQLVRLPLSLDCITVRYPARESAALDQLSLVIPPGQMTAIVGPSGCGKSTLIRLLVGLQVPDTGVVRIGTADLATVDAAMWHRRLAWLPQSPRFVSGSSWDNITLGRPDAPGGAVRAAAALADLPDVLDAAPTTLSAGQRQRVALARVFLRTDASLLFLDEPTAHLDEATEQRICATLADFTRGRTVVIVTHRPALLELADRVVDLGAGEVARPGRRVEAVTAS